MEAALQRYIGNSVAPSTKTAYASAQRRYLGFCEATNVNPPYPLHEPSVCRYVAYLVDQGLKHRTIKAYLSGLRFAQTHLELDNPLQQSMPQLEYVLTGIKRVQARQGPRSDRRLPITLEVLQSLWRQWKEKSPNVDNSMLWAAACTVFLGISQGGRVHCPIGISIRPRSPHKSG